MDGGSFYANRGTTPDQESAGKMGMGAPMPPPAASPDPSLSIEPGPDGTVRVSKVFGSMPEAVAFVQSMEAPAQGQQLPMPPAEPLA